jgi:predicted nucleic acid-binding protein
MKSPICVDASLVVALLIPERFSEAALALWKEWTLQDWQIVAPMLLRYEVTAAIYRKVLQEVIKPVDGRQALQHFLTLAIDWIDLPDLSLRAVDLAEKFRRPNTYDAHYLALAEHLDCPFWTGDERLYNAAHASFRGIFWLGNYHLAE